MTQPAAIHFVDSALGKCSASVKAVGDGVAMALQLGEKSEVALNLSAPAAVQLAHAILSAAGYRATLPQSRQIGGIIGPY